MNGIKLILLILLLLPGCSLTGELVVSAQHENVTASYRVCSK